MLIIKKSYIVMLCGMVTLLAACSSDERAEKYLERGISLFAAGDYTKARLEFRNVLQIKPKHVEGRYQFALTEEKLGNWKSAFEQFLSVEQLDPSHVGAIVHIGALYLSQGDVQKAQQKAEAALVLQKNNTEAHVLLGGVYLRLENIGKAIQHTENALAQNMDNIEAISLRVYLYLKNKENDKAIEYVKNSLKRSPKEITLHLLQATIYADLGQNDLAVSKLNDIIAIEPDEVEHHIRLANYYKKINNSDQLEASLRDTINKFPTNEDVQLLLVESIYAFNRTEQAENLLLKFIQQSPDSYRLRLSLALLYTTSNKLDKAKQVYKDIIEKDINGLSSLLAKTRLAMLLIKEKHISQAEALIEQVLKVDPRYSEALLIRGGISLTKNDADAAISDFNVVLQYEPNSIKALMQLARAQLLNKQAELAKQNIQKVINARPSDRKSRMALAELLLETENRDDAILQLKAILNDNPKDIDTLKALVPIYVNNKDWVNAEKMVEQIKKAEPDNALGHQMMGVVLQEQMRFHESIHEFEQVLSKVPDAVEPLLAMIKSYNALKQPEKALKRIQQVIRQSPQNYFAYNLLGMVLLKEKKLPKAEQAFRKAIDIKNDSIQPYKNLASLYRLQKDSESEIRILQAGLEATDDNPSLLFALVYAYEAEKNYDKAITVYEKILSKQPGNELASNNLAMILINYKGDNKSMIQARKLVEIFESTENPYFADTLGWVYYHNGELDKAQQVLESAFLKAPEMDVLNYHLGMVYYKQGITVAAKQHLQKALRGKSDYLGMKEATETLGKL